jgi:hypothetical protein
VLPKLARGFKAVRGLVEVRGAHFEICGYQLRLRKQRRLEEVWILLPCDLVKLINLR